jgi:hypothetical protein
MNSMIHRAGTRSLALALLGPVTAQLPVPYGFADQLRWQHNRLINLSFDLLPGGEVMAADDAALFRLGAQGQRVDVWSLPVGAMVAFVRATPDGTAVLVGESVQGRIYRIDVVSGQGRLLTTVPFPFDMEFLGQGQAILSANLQFGTPGARNQLLLLDAVTGSTRSVASLAGPSGPLALGSDGALFYAAQVYQFPTPPGAVRILRFPPPRVQAAIAGGPVMTEADAGVFAAGLDGAYAMTRDDQGRIYVSDPGTGGVRRFDAAGRSEAFLPATGTHFETVLRFRGPGPGTFAPCQPDGSGELWCVETDWLQATRLRTVTPVRPRAVHLPANPVPAGQLDLFLTGGPPSGSALCLLSRTLGPGEQHVILGNGAPLWFAIDPSRLVLISWRPVDATGLASLALAVPAGVVADLGCQWLVVTADQSVLATSWAEPVQLR